MSEIQQNTLYLLTSGSYVARDHLTLRVEVPVYPENMPLSQRTRATVIETRKLSVPIHHLESICLFGPSTVSPGALDLCWENGVAVNFLSEHGHFQARMTGVADTSVTLRRAQFRTADNPARCAAIARQIVAGKIQNARNSLLRASRENNDGCELAQLQSVIDALANQIHLLAELDAASADMDALRGSEGLAAQQYFSVFSFALKQQRETFQFTKRSRRPTRDRINCLPAVLSVCIGAARLCCSTDNSGSRSVRRIFAHGQAEPSIAGSGPDGRVSPLACGQIGDHPHQSPANFGGTFCRTRGRRGGIHRSRTQTGHQGLSGTQAG
jgi:CRISP-associated protein Cas1